MCTKLSNNKNTSKGLTTKKTNNPFLENKEFLGLFLKANFLDLDSSVLQLMYVCCNVSKHLLSQMLPLLERVCGCCRLSKN